MDVERYDPAGDPDAVLCPAGCGRLTDDISGGICSRCAAERRREDREAVALLGGEGGWVVRSKDGRLLAALSSARQIVDWASVKGADAHGADAHWVDAEPPGGDAA